MARKPAKAKAVETRPQRIPELVLLGLVLCILALRVTYTEAPTAQSLTAPNGLTDTLYTVTISGLLIFALAGWLLWRICTDRFRYRFTGMEVGLVLLFLATAVSIPGASDKRLAIHHTVTLLGPVFAGLLLAQILDRRSSLILVLIVIAALGVVSTYQCAEQFLVSNQVTIEQYEETPEILLEPLGIEPGTFKHFLFEHRLYSRGIRGFFTTSNSAASFAILAAFAAVIVLARSGRDSDSPRSQLRNRLLPAAAAAIIIAGLLLTQSKGGIMACLLGAAVLALSLWVRHRFGARARKILVIAVAVGLLGAAGACYVLISYGTEHGRLPGGNSMLVRWQYWEATARMCADHPLTGVGPGNFADYYPHYKPAAALESVADPHNFVLSFLAQYGPLGLLGFLLMVLVPLWRSVASGASLQTAEAKTVRPSFRSLSLAMLCAISACLLFLRPMLMPSSADGDLDIWLYEILTLHVTPVAAFLIGFFLLAATFDESGKGPRPLRVPLLVAALVSAILAVLLHNLIDFALFEPGVWTAFWTAIACLAATTRKPQEPPAETRPTAPGLKLTAAVVAIALVGVYYAYAWKPVRDTTALMQRAQRAIATGQLEQAHALLDAASDADPLSAASLGLNGRLYVQQYEQSGTRQTDLLERALRCFGRAVEISPADYKNYEKLGIVHSRLERWQEACDWYRRA
ncbi:MAG: O-antigen ligase family protein, partial [Sedimentisphaerales bacterium]|nr:O-antigen ligase family protein [Sedimentisphaerales bacterium]